MVVDRPDDRWLEVATRLVADTALLDRRFEHDVFGELGPSKPMGARVLDAGRLVITRMERLTERLDVLYGAELDPATREQLSVARQQLRATVEALTGLPEGLDPNHRRR